MSKTAKLNTDTKPSHFLAFPIYLDEHLRETVGKFQERLFELRKSDANDGLDKSLIMKPWRLHISIGVVGLEEESAQASGKNKRTITSTVQLLEELKPKITEILNGKKLTVSLDKLDITQPAQGGAPGEKMAHVLFVGPTKVESDDPLQRVMDLVYNRFMGDGYITENRSKKIHCTVLNTRYRKPKGQGKIPFSYTQILESEACDILGMERVEFSRDTHRKISALKDIEIDRIELWKMGSHVGGERDTYIKCGELLLDGKLPEVVEPTEPAKKKQKLDEEPAKNQNTAGKRAEGAELKTAKAQKPDTSTSTDDSSEVMGSTLADQDEGSMPEVSH